MAQKQTILSERFDTVQALHFTLESLESISNSQFFAIRENLAPHLPGIVRIYQRSHKGALTATLGDVVIEITHRGKIARAYRTL